jgi:hypothetical protein
MANIKISQLPNINSNLTSTALIPIVSTNGMFITDKLTVAQLGNYILDRSGYQFANANISKLAYNVVNAAQSNITSVGTLTQLHVTGTANLGYVDDVKIYGGSTGQVLSTDGNGNLSWNAGLGGSTGATGATGVTGANGIVWTTIPVANNSLGTAGAAAYDTGGNLYVCVATNTWAKFVGTTSWS